MTSRRSQAAPLALCLCLAPALAARLPALAAGAAPAPPTPAGEVFGESIDVDVVNVQVFVDDRSGRPVAGLGRGDFELRVDGKPVPITNFYAGGEPSAAAPGAPPSPDAGGSEGQRLSLALFVDNSNLSAPGRYRALQALEGFFRTALHRDDRVLIAIYDPEKLVVLRPRAGDVGAIAAAFRGIASTRALSGHTAAAEVSGRDFEGPARDAEREAAASQVEMAAGESALAGRLLLGSLDDFIGSVAGLPGRKAVLYLTENLPAAADDSLFLALVRRASAARVTLYGLGFQEPDKTLGSQLENTLYHLAAPTGGRWGVDLQHPAALLDHIRDDLVTYYSLGFAPVPPYERAGHRLEVRVPGRPGLTVRFPEGYTARGREERLGDRAVAALELGVADNPLGVRLAIAGDRPAPNGRRQVSLFVELPLAKLTLVPGQGAHPERAGKMALVAVARDVRGRRLAPQRATVPIRVPEGRLPAAMGQTAAYRLLLELPPGAATIAVALADELGGQESVVTGHYAVGGAGAGAAKAAKRPPPSIRPSIRPDVRPDVRPETRPDMR